MTNLVSSVSTSTPSLQPMVNKHVLPQVREQIAAEVSSRYAKEMLDVAQMSSSEDIIRHLTKDPIVNVRKILATNLRYSADVPHDIMVQLAYDVNEVSIPILLHAVQLTDDDLRTMIRLTQDSQKWLAIASREVVSAAVVEALLHLGNSHVCVRLLRNAGADIETKHYHFMLDHHAGDNAMMSALVDKGGLPRAIVQRLLGLVSGDLEKQLLTIYPIFKGQDVQAFNVSSTLQMVNASVSSDKVAIKVKRLKAENNLHISSLLQALCDGDMLFFKMALFEMAGERFEPASTELIEQTTLRQLCYKAKIPMSLIPALTILIRFGEQYAASHALTSGVYRDMLLEYILDHGYEESVPLMAYVLVLMSASTRYTMQPSKHYA